MATITVNGVAEGSLKEEQAQETEKAYQSLSEGDKRVVDWKHALEKDWARFGSSHDSEKIAQRIEKKRERVINDLKTPGIEGPHRKQYHEATGGGVLNKRDQGVVQWHVAKEIESGKHLYNKGGLHAISEGLVQDMQDPIKKEKLKEKTMVSSPPTPEQRESILVFRQEQDAGKIPYADSYNDHKGRILKKIKKQESHAAAQEARKDAPNAGRVPP